MEKKKIIIIGGGPAGLTAGYEIAKKGEFHPIVLEQKEYLGGISCTINYKGNRMDIGGHRFFSKSDKVMAWWLAILPLLSEEENIRITYQNQHKNLENNPNPEYTDDEQVMLLRNRKSRIFYKRQFFDYPLSLNYSTFRKLGLLYSINMMLSYAKAKIYPIKNEKNLKDFFINRFGEKLYFTFFKDYTEKVWGVPCQEISAEWGRQRIKGLSVRKIIEHFFKNHFSFKNNDISQKQTETSLIERFLYPKYGPGQMWEKVAQKIKENYGTIHTEHQVTSILLENNTVKGVEVWDSHSKQKKYLDCDYLISSMPIQILTKAISTKLPKALEKISQGLVYRDFITVGVLLKKMKTEPLDDNWIYVQEPDVKLGRIQIFNNWSEALVKDKSQIWLGLEYFCYQGDELWQLSEQEMIAFALSELVKINFIEREDCIDATVVKVPKTYPAYFGSYQEFSHLRAYLDAIPNLFLVGRNGMHKYNNQDHSMLTAMKAVENIHEGIIDKSSIWDINTEQDYHESKSAATQH